LLVLTLGRVPQADTMNLQYRLKLDTSIDSAQYVVIVQYPIEEERGSVGSSSLHVKHYPSIINYLA